MSRALGCLEVQREASRTLLHGRPCIRDRAINAMNVDAHQGRGTHSPTSCYVTTRSNRGRWSPKTLRRRMYGQMPRRVMRYSPAAGRHTEHTVERVKKRRASNSSGVNVVSGASLQVAAVSTSKARRSRKPTKRINLIYRCGNWKSPLSNGQRAKKFELVDK